MFKWAQKRIIGLDVDEDRVSACEFAQGPSTLILRKCVVSSGLSEASRGVSAKDAVVFISIPAQIVLFRSFYIPPALAKSKNQNKDITAFLARQNLPFKLEECFWDTFIWDNSLNFIAAKKEMAGKYILAVEDAGFRCAGVTVPLVALYNVLIYNYPQRSKDRFAVLNIRNSTSDLVIYEPRRLWAYPLSMGKKDLTPSSLEAQAKFTGEVQRVLNSHYMQNPQSSSSTPGYFYLSGSGWEEALILSLKKAIVDFEISSLEPFKKVNVDPGANPAAAQAQVLALSAGLGICGFGPAGGLKLNLIKTRAKKEKELGLVADLKKLAFIVLCAAASALMFMNIASLKDLSDQVPYYFLLQTELSSLLPQVRSLQADKEKINALKAFLEKRLKQQMLYLKTLAVISESKSPYVIISEFLAEKKDALIGISISGVAPAYEDINNFLANLKKHPDIKNVKVVASTFSGLEQAGQKGIDFKLRFEIAL